MALPSSLVAAAIPLPQDYIILYSRWTLAPTTTSAASTFETARKAIWAMNGTRSLSQSFLATIHLDISSFLYLFRITSYQDMDSTLSLMDQLVFEGLTATQALPLELGTPIQSHFQDAVRIHILNDFANSSISPIHRLNSGFLIRPPKASNDWTAGWERVRSLLYCHLHVHLVDRRLLVQPILLSTPFVPIGNPLPAGTPIMLLPYGTPAYYLAPYTGPTSAISRQFRDALVGLALGDWDSPKTPASYIIAWITVENKQGEDKGITVIYPTKLSFAFSDASSFSSRSLPYIPELPAQLQSSPQLVHQTPHLGPHSLPLAGAFSSGPLTPTTARAFQLLHVSRARELSEVAVEVGDYVHAVARERDRERERLKREREIAAAPKATPGSASALTPGPSSVTLPSESSTPTTAHFPSVPLPPTFPPPPSTQHLQQTFYPSPPQTNQPIPSRLSPAVGESSAMDATPADPAPPETPTIEAAPPSDLPNESLSIPIQSPIGGAFDPYAMDASWMGMDMDMDLDFGMDMGFSFPENPTPNLNPEIYTSGGPSNGTFAVPAAPATTTNPVTAAPSAPTSSRFTASTRAADFDTDFTDDDFNFFDNPAPANQVPSFSPPASLGGFTGAPLEINHHIPVAAPLISPGLFSGIPPTPLHTSWELTPRFTTEHDGQEFLPSPGQTPGMFAFDPQDHHIYTHETPRVHLDSPFVYKQSPDPKDNSINTAFEPIPFASRHRVADGKYAFGGKFALPSPPRDSDDSSDDDDPPIVSSAPVVSNMRTYTHRRRNNDGGSWYKLATDPRVGVIVKLHGAKRKFPSASAQHKVSRRRLRPSWGSELNPEPPPTHHGDFSDEEEEEDEEDPTSSLPSPITRPSTPIPPYLPLGPTLPSLQFTHFLLLPLSKPLRSAVAPTPLTQNRAVLSVPTPVSPANLSSENSKTMEIAALMLVTEIVENSVWGDVWLAHNSGGSQTTYADKLLSLDIRDVGMNDVRIVKSLLGSIGGAETNLDISSIFDSDLTLTPLPPPTITTGKSSALIQILPSSLRFWEKLDLSPRAGRKNVSAYILYDEATTGTGMETGRISGWFERVRKKYENMHFGAMTQGSTQSSDGDGLLPIRFDNTFRKRLTSTLSTLPTSQQSTVFFLLLPPNLLTLSSPVFRHIMVTIHKLQSQSAQENVLIHLIPPTLPYQLELDQLVQRLYSRIKVGIDRSHTHAGVHHRQQGIPLRKYIAEPSYCLSPPSLSSRKISFTHTPTSQTTLDVTNRHTFLHVGYGLSPCQRWIVACCVDERGENGEVGVWARGSKSCEEGDGDARDKDGSDLDKIWNFTMRFAEQANVEWRIVIARFGVMDRGELDAWKSLLTQHPKRAYHISLLSVDQSSPWMFIPPPVPSPPAAPPTPTPMLSKSLPAKPTTSYFVDSKFMTCALYAGACATVRAPTLRDLGLDAEVVRGRNGEVDDEEDDGDGEGETEAVIDRTLPPPTPLSSTALIRFPLDNGKPITLGTGMLWLHLLHNFAMPGSTYHDPTLMKDVTTSFHELAELASLRGLTSGSGLPYHLAAVERGLGVGAEDRGVEERMD